MDSVEDKAVPRAMRLNHVLPPPAPAAVCWMTWRATAAGAAALSHLIVSDALCLVCVAYVLNFCSLGLRVIFLLPVPLEFDSMYFIVKNLRRQIEIPPDKFGKMIDVLSPARVTAHFVCL